jgi:COP9 signalosome complex subunit 1
MENSMDIETSENVTMSSGLPDTVAPVIFSSLNLNSYIARYDGYTKLQRLIFIAEKCANLQEDAYRLLLIELKRGCNTAMYLKLTAQLGNGTDFDREWVETIERRELAKLERLEAELMAAKTTMVKESIRLSYNDIGDLHYERGNLADAMKSYSRTRDYCTIPKHHLDMWVRLISVSMDLGQYGNVNFYMTKAENTVIESAAGAKIKAAGALVMLIEGQFKAAARKFLEVGWDLGGSFSTIIAAEDIAVYGTLCALASLDRTEIRKKLLENSVFKSFLELVPGERLLVDNFFAGKYGDCLAYLERIKPELLLDVHLSKHVVPLISQITERIVLQFFSPYSSLDLNKMATTLNMNAVDLEVLVAALISSGKISARIDSESRTLHRRQHDVRSLTLEKVEKLSAKHLTEVKRGILRLSVMQHGLQVTSRESNSSGRGMSSGGSLSHPSPSLLVSSSSYKSDPSRGRDRDPADSGSTAEYSNDIMAGRGGALAAMGNSISIGSTFASLAASASRVVSGTVVMDTGMADIDGEGEDDDETED